MTASRCGARHESPSRAAQREASAASAQSSGTAWITNGWAPGPCTTWRRARPRRSHPAQRGSRTAGRPGRALPGGERGLGAVIRHSVDHERLGARAVHYLEASAASAQSSGTAWITNGWAPGPCTTWRRARPRRSHPAQRGSRTAGRPGRALPGGERGLGAVIRHSVDHERLGARAVHYLEASAASAQSSGTAWITNGWAPGPCTTWRRARPRRSRESRTPSPGR